MAPMSKGRGDYKDDLSVFSRQLDIGGGEFNLATPSTEIP